MTLSILGSVSTAAGEIIIAYVVLSVHSHIMKEKKVDSHIFAYMRRERTIGAIGIGLIILGLLLDILAKTYLV